MRTYTRPRGARHGRDTRLVVDFVLHLDDGRHRARARVGGDRAPGRPAGDDRAAPRRPLRRHRVRAGHRPATCCWPATRPPSRPSPRSWSACPRDRAATAFLEVPARRRRARRRRPGRRGGRLAAARRCAAGGAAARGRRGPPRALRPAAGRGGRRRGRPGPVGDPDVLLLGRGGCPRTAADPHGDLYAWIAGESKVVTGATAPPGARTSASTGARSPSWATGAGASRCAPEST